MLFISELGWCGDREGEREEFGEEGELFFMLKFLV